MRRAAGDVEVDRARRCAAPFATCGMVDERPARDRAGADRDHDLRGRHRVVGLLQREAHVARHRAGDQQAVGVARRGDELDAEAAEVPADGAEDVRRRPRSRCSRRRSPAAGAASGRTARRSLLVERARRGALLRPALAEDQVLTRVAAPGGSRRVCVIAPVGHSLDAVGAEEAAAQVERDRRVRRPRDGLRRADVAHALQPSTHFDRIDAQRAAGSGPAGPARGRSG